MMMLEPTPSQLRSCDLEKATVNIPPNIQSAIQDTDQRSKTMLGRFKQTVLNFEQQLEGYKLEVRGIQRVELKDRHDLQSLGYVQAALFWFSINLAANNIALGMLGPTIFNLGFTDSALCAIFGMLVGCLPVAYISTFGPRSGNRTMIFSRYTMGWWPSRLVVLLNLIVLLGYALIDCVVAGQILSAVFHDLSIFVGIVIVAVLTWAITTFGYHIFHYYERYAYLPQLVVLCILAGVAGPHFDIFAPSEAPDTRTLTGNRLSFFSLCLAAAVTYSGGACDYFAYYPEPTPCYRIFVMTMLGLSLSFTFSFLIGIGLASPLLSGTNAAWASAYQTSQGTLIVEAFGPLGAFGSFCGVIVALGLVQNLIPPTYSAGLNFQILGNYATSIPRIIWNTFGVVLYTTCAVAGREHLAEIFTNFLALMGYWVSIWVAITLEEHVLFRTKWSIFGLSIGMDKGWNWAVWDQQKQLPLGIAALIAFLVGWVGAILCMAQFWYVGAIAKLVGENGADIGSYVGFSWAAVTFPLLRYWELSLLGR